MRKFTSTLIILAVMTILTSCKSDKNLDNNPFFAEWDTPFEVPPFDKIYARHYMPAFEEGMARQLAEIDSIVNNSAEPDFENVMLALDRSGEFLGRVQAVFGGLNGAAGNDSLQAINVEISPRLTSHSNKIRFNEKLFEKIKAVYDKRSRLGLDEQQLRLVEKTYKNYAHAGALLSSEQKEELGKLNEELSSLSVTFGNNLIAESKDFLLILDHEDQLSGLTAALKESGTNEARKRSLSGKWAFQLSKSDMIPFLTNSDHGDLREKYYKAYLNQGNNDNANDNKKVVEQIAHLRLKKANLMGYPTFAAYELDKDRMAKTPENAYDLMNKLWDPALKLAKEELEQMRQIKLNETNNSLLESWDWWYYAEKLRKEKYDLDESVLHPYFSLENVTQGIFWLCNRLWGITFRPIPAPTYHPDCLVYEVMDQDNTHLAVLYMDFFARPGSKRAGAWCGTYRSQKYKDGKRMAPVVTIVCNFTPPTGRQQAFLTLDEVETYFHEFGHGLHNFFSDVKYAGIRGTERDFVELPSQIMENWAFQPEVLRHYAKHYNTSAIIPEDLIQKIQQSSYFNQGFMTTELVAASLIDLDIHTLTSTDPIDVPALEYNALYAKRGLISEIEPRYHYTYFNHIFASGYAAGYYSYLWAEVLDQDVFQAFVETGDLFNRKVAHSFRKNILERGGISDGMEMYRNFRGKDPDVTPLMVNRGLIPAPIPTVPVVDGIDESAVVEAAEE